VLTAIVILVQAALPTNTAATAPMLPEDRDAARPPSPCSVSGRSWSRPYREKFPIAARPRPSTEVLEVRPTLYWRETDSNPRSRAVGLSWVLVSAGPKTCEPAL
jgi:hypothetical protein